MYEKHFYLQSKCSYSVLYSGLYLYASFTGNQQPTKGFDQKVNISSLKGISATFFNQGL